MPPISHRRVNHSTPIPFGKTALVLACALGVPMTLNAQESPPAPEEVLVTATLLPRTTDEIAGTVSFIGREQMERQLIEDLGEMTRLHPGVNMETASRGGNQGFAIRGLGGNRVLTVIDGIRSNDIYAAGPSSYGKDSFETDDLRAVEIIRGPASVLYGADAMGGAVILRTRDPQDYLREGKNSALSLRSSASDVNHLLKTGVSYAFQNGDLGTVLQATKRRFEEQQIGGSAQLNPQDGNSTAWMWKSVWQASAEHTLRFNVDAYQEEIDTRIDSDLSRSVQQSLGFDSSDRLRFSVQHSWQTQLAFADRIDSQLHWQRSEGEQITTQRLTSYAFVDPRNPQTFRGSLAQRYSDFDFNQETRSGGIMLSKALDTNGMQHAMVYGVSIERTDTERPRQRCDTQVSNGAQSCAIPSYPMAPPEVFPNKTFPDTNTSRAGLYWQDEITLGEGALRLIPGLRYDSYAMDPHVDALLNGGGDISHFGGYKIAAVDTHQGSLSLGALYDLSPSISAFAQYAEGYRPPNFDESNQAFVNLGHGYATVPNPALKAESSRGIETGLRMDLGAADVSLALYHNRYEDFIESKTVGSVNGISLFQDSNLGAAEIYGAELNAQWQLNAAWQLRSALAWSRGEDKRSGRPLDSVSPLQAVLSTRYDALDNPWGAEALLSLTGAQKRVSAADRVQGEAYAVLDLVAYYTLRPGTSIRAGVFNLLDEEYAPWSNIKGLAASDSNNIAKSQAPGTNLRLSINYEF